MKNTKCGHCGLTNLETDLICHRCGRQVGSFAATQKKSRPNRAVSWLYYLMALALVGSAVAYVYFGFEKSYTQVEKNETKRLAKQANSQPVNQTRSQFEKQATVHYGTALQNSNSLAQSQKHVDEVQKLMEPSKR